jgi:predicted ester cyclase/heme-degrading monooxygenase HmoA
MLIIMLMIPGFINAQALNNNKKKEIHMNTNQQNKDVVQKAFEQGLNKRNFELLKECIADDFTGVQGKKGPAAFYEPILPLIKSFPDIQWKIDEFVAEGDKVFIHWKWQGTQTAPFFNVATGKTVANEGMAAFTIKEGKIGSAQVLTDRLGFLQALDVLPTDVSVLYNRKAHNGQVNFIDKFFVPAAAITAFRERVQRNRNFIKQLPGFIEDAAYEYTDSDGNLIFITVTLWQSQDALNKAKEAVQAEYKKEGFDAPAMFKKLGITLDRGIYTQMHE